MEKNPKIPTRPQQVFEIRLDGILPNNHTLNEGDMIILVDPTNGVKCFTTPYAIEIDNPTCPECGTPTRNHISILCPTCFEKAIELENLEDYSQEELDAMKTTEKE